MTLVPLHALVMPPNMPSGLDWAVLGLWCCTFRKTPEPCHPPVQVERIEGTEFYRISDGRHRVVASLIAGRSHIEATITDPGERP